MVRDEGTRRGAARDGLQDRRLDLEAPLRVEVVAHRGDDLRPFDEDAPSELYMDSKQYAEYFAKLFELYLQDYKSGNYVSVRHLDNMVSLYLGGGAEQCGMIGHCARQFVVEANGNVYPCDFYCLDEWLLGNINDSDFVALSRLPKSIDFLRNSLEIPQRCKSCKYYPLCRGGGCKRNRDSVDYCEAYKIFFEKYIKYA